MVISRLRLSRAVTYLLLLAWALFMILPFAWMILTSLKTMSESVRLPIQWFPKEPQWRNYLDVLRNYNYGRYYANTTFVTVVIVAFQLITSSMAAYAFARLSFPGKSLMFMACLCVLMVPAQMIMIPRFIMVKSLNWINTFQGIIIPALPSIYGTFFLRQNFMSLPRELDESAMLDGCSYFGIYLKILLPLIKNGLIAYAVLTALWSWNELLWPLIVVYSEKMYVLSIAMASMQGQFVRDLPIVMTAGTYSMLPMLVLFIVGQKSLLEGIALSGLKA